MIKQTLSNNETYRLLYNSPKNASKAKKLEDADNSTCTDMNSTDVSNKLIQQKESANGAELLLFVASLACLLATCGLFNTIYSASKHFKGFIDTFFGAGLQHQILCIGISHLSTEFVLSIVRFNHRIRQAISKLRNELTTIKSEKAELEAKISVLY